MTNKLVTIQPGELKFSFESMKKSSCYLQLVNNTDNYVAFKVKSTSSKNYAVRPNTDVMAPKATCNVTVTMQAQKEATLDMQCNDKFLVQSVIAPSGVTAKDITSDMFNKKPGRVIEENKLSVLYLYPPQLPSTIPESSEKGQAQKEVTGYMTSDVFSFNLVSKDSNELRAKLSEEVRIDDSDQDETASDAVIAECEAIAHGLQEVRIDDSDQDETASDAVIAECEAIAHGLQIIKNVDLEELQELGCGTFGTVYHGKWRGTDVAIKRIKNSCIMGGPSEQDHMKADFWREACILARTHHPNVVAFYGVVPDGPGGTLATVTEYMVDGSVTQMVQRKAKSIDRRKRLLIAMDAAFGMEYLHSKNIVHFDLKCDNLLVNTRDPQRPICKVGDLGLSKIKHQTFVSGGMRGTLPWMAPELLNGSSIMVSEKVDAFSFGIVMWELLTGKEPYADLHDGALIGGVVRNTLRPHVPDQCDPAWRSLMEQCWSTDPNGRPSFKDIANQLRAMAMSFRSKVHGHPPHVHHG
ncbi:hypothetical protein SUGI_0043900 [Cryptomeria japonica]|uniref:serine/threonine/tyrosine-protein kinase HT1 isoform X2 n=1 Tax=Cryptomeria japonica TaxID=3369 RepID=UPI002408A01B|nr:serine/threonine/tyrosine-protein kinase HT1 isoform X2 [Cryptomeria japonica]GLJ06645.1 hypothetical protein SUGI_0043900 [Cryptomeria japonica]